MSADSADSLVASAGRLRILTALASEPRLEFVRLRERAKLTDGNLASHAKRLESAGLVAIEKHFRAGKPVTTMLITQEGRSALQSHVDGVIAALRPEADKSQAEAVEVDAHDDEWVD